MFFGFASQEEYDAARAEHMRHVEQAEAQNDLLGHQMVRVMSELDEETCFVLTKVLGQIRDAGNLHSPEATTASFWIGLLRGRLQAVFGLCMSCGKKHDDEFKNLIENQPDKDQT